MLGCEPAIVYLRSPNSLCKGSLIKGHGLRVLQIISLNTLVDLNRVPKARTSEKQLPFGINFISNGLRKSRLNLNRKDLEVEYYVVPLASLKRTEKMNELLTTCNPVSR